MRSSNIFMAVVSAVMSFVMYAMAIMLPGLATAQEFKAVWMTLPVSRSASVVAPSAQWTPMLRVKKAKVDQVNSYEYRSGDRWMTLSREDAALVPNLSSAQMSSIMRIPRRDAVMLFGRYVPQSAELVINAIKIEESPDGYMNVYQTYFTPFHGEHWAASRRFLTDAESTDVSRAGRNPFESFKTADRSDPRFVNIGFDGATVAMGLAQKFFRTPYSVLSVQNLRMTQSVTKSGSFLRKKTTIKVDGYAQPSWFIGLPSTMQTWGTTSAICVVPTGTATNPQTGVNQGPSCPDDNLVAFSGVSFDEWKGKMMPDAEEHIYHWEQTKSGFTVLFFTILIMVAAFFVGPMIFAAMSGPGAVGAAAATTITGGEAALWAGAAYAGGSMATTSGPASLTTAKSGVFGSIGDGRIDTTDPGSQQAKEAIAILEKRQIKAEFSPNGGCSDQGTLCSTQSGMTAITPDPTAAQFGMDQRTLRERERYCRSLQLTGRELQVCIVPPTAPVDVP